MDGFGVGAGVGTKAHSFVLQTRSSSGGHFVPPYLLSLVTITVRDCIPVPQVFVQGLHGRHPRCSQFCGHLNVLQSRISDKAGHGKLPGAGLTKTLRKRIDTPLPHFSEHIDQSDQSDTRQSAEGVGEGVGHGCIVHTISRSAGHAIPPCFSRALTIALRDCMP